MMEVLIESAYDGGVDMIVTPYPVCQLNLEAYQSDINAKYKTKFNMPVVYYSALMAVAYGGDGKSTGLDGQITKAKQWKNLASK